MKKETKITIILGICVLLLVGYIVFQEVSEHYFAKGQNDLIIEMNNKGLFPYINRINNNSLEWININQLCGGGE